MAESLFILELDFLHIQGGCSLVIASGRKTPLQENSHLVCVKSLILK